MLLRENLINQKHQPLPTLKQPAPLDILRLSAGLILPRFHLDLLRPGHNPLLHGSPQLRRDGQHITIRQEHQERLERDGHLGIIDDARRASRIGQETLFQLGLVQILLVCVGGCVLAHPEQQELAEGGLRGGGEVREDEGAHESLVDGKRQVADVFDEEVVEFFEGSEGGREVLGDGGQNMQEALAEDERSEAAEEGDASVDLDLNGAGRIGIGSDCVGG